MNAKLCLSLLLLPSLIVAGCGSPSDGKPESMASSEAQVEDMVNARKIFDASADKNFDTLPADKKADYAKLVHAKDEAAAKVWWNRMGSGGASSPTMGQR
ncbi:hypothetical protein EON82_08170 [bacterium]|nr:MAG: hypothetical protein EON82_08170 [bacterium]